MPMSCASLGSLTPVTTEAPVYDSRWKSPVLLGVLFLLAGCNSSTIRRVEPSPRAPKVEASARPDSVVELKPNKPYKPQSKRGDYDDNAVGGVRPAQVFVPSGYESGSPLPLVVLLHGYSVSGAIQELYFRFAPHADQRGFLYVGHVQN
jgi:hypothetical protein